MSQENVDLVLGFQPPPDADFVPLFRDQGTWASLAEALAPRFHADFEVVTRGLPGGDKADAGLDGFKATWLDWLAPWATYHQDVERVVDLGDRVVVLFCAFGQLEGTQTKVRAELASLWTIEAGKVARVEFYATTHAEALEAVGLSA